MEIKKKSLGDMTYNELEQIMKNPKKSNLTMGDYMRLIEMVSAVKNVTENKGEYEARIKRLETQVFGMNTHISNMEAKLKKLSRMVANSLLDDEDEEDD